MFLTLHHFHLLSGTRANRTKAKVSLFLPFYTKAAGEEGDRGWDGWMTSSIQWTWTWANSGRWWGTGRPGMLQFMVSQRVGHSFVTEQQQKDLPMRCTCMLSHFSHLWLCATLWTATHQAPLFMGFSRQEYWSGLPCAPHGIVLTQGLNPQLLHLLRWQACSFITNASSFITKPLSLWDTFELFLFPIVPSCG